MQGEGAVCGQQRLIFQTALAFERCYRASRASRTRHVPGIIRLPMNRMEGVRSACWAAWRRTLVENMVAICVYVWSVVVSESPMSGPSSQFSQLRPILLTSIAGLDRQALGENGCRAFGIVRHRSMEENWQ